MRSTVLLRIDDRSEIPELLVSERAREHSTFVLFSYLLSARNLLLIPEKR